MSLSWTHLLLFVSLIGISWQQSQNCHFTVGGPAGQGALCHFPFKFNGIVYQTCTTALDPDNRPWCSTRTTRQGEHIGGQGFWGHCSPGCQFVQNSAISNPPIQNNFRHQNNQNINGHLFIQSNRNANLNQGFNSGTTSTPASSQFISNQKTFNSPTSFANSQQFTTPLSIIPAVNFASQTSSSFDTPQSGSSNSNPQTSTQLSRLPKVSQNFRRNPKLDSVPNFRPFRPPGSKQVVPQEPIDQSTRGDWLPDPDSLQDCGISYRAGYIVGGRDAAIGEFPFIALLGYDKNNRVEYRCGGTLINRRYVVTAAHCHSEDAESNKIAEVVLNEWRVGEDPDCKFGCKPVQRIRNNEIIVHEDWRLSGLVTKGNDIALIRLSELAITKNEDLDVNVLPICLPWKRPPSDEEYALYGVAGWGKVTQSRFDSGDLRELGVLEKTLQAINLTLVTNEECRNWPNANYQSLHQSRFICAGNTFGKDSCGGDSGGPLFARGPNEEDLFFLRGIVSFGSKTCGIGNPGVYTDVHQYLPWIRSHMRP